jgi:hypothetical protein
VVAVDDALEVVALTTAGSVRMAAYHPGGTLSDWTDLGGTGLTGAPAVVVYPGFRLRVFARDVTGAVVSRTPGGSWARVGDLVAAGSPAALLEPVSGRTEVIARRADGTIHAIRETGQGTGAWGNWVEAPAGGFVAATDPTVLSYTNSSGPTYLFVARDADNAQHVWFPFTA